MILHPEVQARAQKEIDETIGTGRLPEFEDRISLPYLECILQETLRYESCDIIVFSFLQSNNTNIDGILPPLLVRLHHAPHMYVDSFVLRCSASCIGG